MPFLLDDIDESSFTFEDLPTTTGAAANAAFQEAYRSNPLQLLKSSADLYSASNSAEPKLSVESATEQLGGLQISVPKDGITQSALDLLKKRKTQELVLQSRRARAPAGLVTGSAELAAGLGASTLDPFNLALSFVPVVGQARYAAMLSRAGTQAGSRLAVRAGVGAVEGAVGAAIVEPAVYAGSRYLQDDYSMMDSMTNVLMGATIGSVAHSGFGAVSDAVRARKAASASPEIAPDTAAPIVPEEFTKALDDTPVLVKEHASRSAVVQMIDDRQVNIEALLANSDEFVLRNMEADARLQSTLAQSTEGLYPALRTDLESLKAQQIPLSEVKALKLELQQLATERNSLVIDKAQVQQVKATVDKSLSNPERKAAAYKQVKNQIEAQQAPLKARIAEIEAKLKQHEVGADAVKMLSRLDQNMAPQKLIDAASTTPEIKAMQAQLKTAMLEALKPSQQIRRARNLELAKAVERASISAFDDVATETAVTARFDAIPKAMDAEQAKVEVDEIQAQVDVLLPPEAQELFKAYMQPYDDAIKRANEYGKAARQAASCQLG